MCHRPLGSGWSGWIVPATSAVNVDVQVRTCVAVEPLGYVNTVWKFVSVWLSASADAVTMRMPFCLVEKVALVALLVTLRMKSPNFHSIARSESVGVGSIMSIVPLNATVNRMPENEQPAKLNCRESGTRSPSLFAGGSGPIAGHGPDPDNDGVVAEPPTSAANGVVLDSKVTLDARRSTSVVSSCAMSLA